MRVLVCAIAASWLVAAPASADEGRTGRGGDADGRALLFGNQGGDRRLDPGSQTALLMVRALVDQLVEEGALSKEGAARVLERAKAFSAAQPPQGWLQK
jgi:hypothetical protein